MSGGRTVLILGHPRRPKAVSTCEEVVAALCAAGLKTLLLITDEIDVPGCESAERVDEAGAQAALDHVELVLVLGGDGTVLRAAELVIGTTVPLLAVNLGHVGFLAEVEPEQIELTVRHVVDREYTVEQRATLRADLVVDGAVVHTGWALNDVSIEKGARERVLEVVVEVDSQPVTSFGCDGVVMATPTGSTAYSFSAGGPVVWPAVEAIVLTPISAHALFARPLVVPPSAVLAVEVMARTQADAVMWCDGRRAVGVPRGARIAVTGGRDSIHLARVTAVPFADRLVAKFRLPVGGWRGASETKAEDAPTGGEPARGPAPASGAAPSNAPQPGREG